MMASVMGATVLATTLGVGTPARAIRTFFGEDTVNSTSLSNASAAEADFLSNLVGVGTETFEGFANGQNSPLSLSFPGAGTASLFSGMGEIETGNSFGRFPISGNKYWEVCSNFALEFSEEIAAFGFYGTDIGDFSGQVMLTLENTLTGFSKMLTINNTINAPNGSALYYGLIAETGELFNKITFSNTRPGLDVFGFDNMTIGSVEQVVPNPKEVPEPASLLGFLAVGALGTSSILKRKGQ